jgi:hypothetical protein
MSRSLGNAQAICAPFARALSHAYTLQDLARSRCTFDRHSATERDERIAILMFDAGLPEHEAKRLAGGIVARR